MSRAIPAPPATIAAPTPHATTPGDTFAAHRITTAGPTMYDSSPCTDSSANAARRCPAVVIAAIACLVTDWAGTISRPAAKAAPSRIPYGRIGTLSQNTTCATTVTSSTVRRPRQSIMRPSSGPPSATPAVSAAATPPAAA